MEAALYKTDKHVQDNIDDLCAAMTLDGVHTDDISDIYVLGHSFGEPDLEYFDSLNKVTKIGSDLNLTSALWQAQSIDINGLDEQELLDFIAMNIIYATEHRSRVLGKGNIPFPVEDARECRMRAMGYRSLNVLYSDAEIRESIHKRFIIEEALRTKEVMEDLCIVKGVEEVPEDAQCASVLKLASYLDGGHAERAGNAHRHTSYHSEADRKRIKGVMKAFGCSYEDYTLYPSIDVCLRAFRL